ncbi:class I SAM-dependent methyltransferase [Kribbella sp. NBC_00382]|uniref:class I SAM-dependent methyltransferase n=1 Tax=Kribbella sp. NBC_00382 TaxID=2975967 RepID=UPI002E24F6BA
MSDATDFRAVYEKEGFYDELLLPHFYGGVDDAELLRRRLAELYSAESLGALRVAEFGAGTGRMTEHLAPFADSLIVNDYSAQMIKELTARFPGSTPLHAGARAAVTDLHEQGMASRLDLIGAFWSLSYPLGEYFEELTATGITPVEDQQAARVEAQGFVRDIVRLLAPGGRLLAMFFDSETAEQQFVTRQWERVAPFPEGGRSYTRDLLINALLDEERDGTGTVSYQRLGGAAVAADEHAAVRWMLEVHLKNLPQLVESAQVRREVEEFVGRWRRPDSSVVLPTGLYFIEFQRQDHPAAQAPR